MKHKYTPEKPLEFRCRDEGHKAELITEIRCYLEIGGVKVWHDMEISRRAGGRVWITGPEGVAPDWRAGEEILITDPRCIVLRTPTAAPLVTRSYLDLERFTAACEAAGVRTEMTVRTFYHGEFDDWTGHIGKIALPPSHVPRHSRTLHCVVFYHSRHPVAEWGGTEEYEARLPIVPFEHGDTFHGPGKPQGLAAWLVQVDESALDTKLISHPDEPIITQGWRVDDADCFHPDSEDPPEGPWSVCYLVDGEVLSGEEYESAALEGSYSIPDDSFVHEEMSAVLHQILDVGAQRRFSPCEHRPGWRHKEFGTIVRGGDTPDTESWEKGVVAADGEFFPEGAAAPAGVWKIVDKWGDEL